MERLHELFRLYYEKTASARQTAELMELINAAPVDQIKALILERGENLVDIDYSLPADKTELILKHILGSADQLAVRKILPWKKWVAAASILLMVTLGSYVLFLKKPTNQSTVTNNKQPDVNPGIYRAKLTLADGRTIILDSTALGELAQQANTAVINYDGQLSYRPHGGSQQGASVYNTVSTRNGEIYSLRLADGSMVTLNSASTIKFPVSFPLKQRRVEISGEAYFIVAKNPKQPFIVSVNGMEVQALGTEFNINAYPDEGTMNTTLIEGLVKVSSVNFLRSAVIRPGQQTRLKESQLSVINDANLDEVIGWKQGFFHFESGELNAILRQIARWYNIEVVYGEPVSNDRYFIIMSRNTTLSTVLKSLEANGVRFRIDGLKLYVLSNETNL